jgi:preprotein translocase subunit YajC
LSFFSILAQAVESAGPTTQGATRRPGGFFEFFATPFFPLLLVLVVMWTFALRSKKKQQQSRQGMLDNLKKHDRVETIGGLIGTVVEVRDGEVLVKADETSNTKLRFRRSAIHRVIVEEEKKS